MFNFQKERNMFSKMLKPAPVFLSIIAVILIPMGVLSEFSTDPNPDMSIDGLICNTSDEDFQEASVEPKKDADGNPTKACSDYGEADCGDATVEYDIIEASTCNTLPQYKELYDLYYYWVCSTEKEIVPNGSCKLVDGNCTDDTSYEGATLYYTSKCSHKLLPRP